MSEAPDVPEWDLADRMRKALQVSEIGVQEMADYLGVARNTVSTWINGRNRPSPATVRLWAMRCEVPYEWLAGGGLRRAPIKSPACSHTAVLEAPGARTDVRSGLGLAA